MNKTVNRNYSAIWWAVAIIVGNLLLLRFSISAPSTSDYWWFLAGGQKFAADGWNSLAQAHPFAFGLHHDSRFYDSEWLFIHLVYSLWSWFGHLGPIILRALLVFGIITFHLLICRSLKASPLISFLVLMSGASTVLVTRLSIRPHVAGYFFVLVLMWMLLRRPNKLYLFLTLGLFALWANIHPSFILGVALVGVVAVWAWLSPLFEQRWPLHFASTAQWKPWLWCFLALPLVIILCNPYGWKLGVIIWKVRQEMMGQFDPVALPEWGPLRLNAYGVFFIAMLLLTILSWLHPANRRHILHLGFIAAATGVALSGNRFVGISFLVISPFLAAYLSAFSWKIMRRSITFGLSGLLVVFLWLMVQGMPPWHLRPDLRLQPEAVFTLLDRYPSLKANVFTEINAGSYLIYRYPFRLKINYDARIVTPHFAAWSLAYRQAMTNPHKWEEFCQSHHCQLAILPVDENYLPLLEYLNAHPSWVPLAFTLRWTLYARRDYEADLLAKHHIHLLRPHIHFRYLQEDQAKRSQITHEVAMLQQQTSDPSAAIAIDCFLVLREAKLFEVFPPLQWNSSQIAQLQRCRAELVKTLVDVPHLSLHYYLGLTLMALGESDAAKHLLRAIELNPVWPSLYLALVHVYWRQNQKQKAFEVMAQMARISPRAAALARSLFSYLQPPTTNKQQSQSP